MSSEPPLDAFVRDVAALANGIVQDEIEPQEGARILARTCSALWSLEAALQVFVALDHDWHDLPQQRTELADEIIKAADRLRANWGP
jgi:hypothetical protein